MDAVLLQYGAIGVIAVVALAVARVLFAKVNEAYKREQERADRLEGELRELNALVRGEYVDTIGRATQAIADALAAVRRQ